MKVRKKTESHWVNTFLMRKWFGVRACWVERFAVSLIVTARRQIFTYKLKYHLNLISHDKNPILQTFRKIKTLRYTTIWSITAIAIVRMIFAKCRYIANEEKNQWIGPFHVESLFWIWDRIGPGLALSPLYNSQNQCRSFLTARHHRKNAF